MDNNGLYKNVRSGGGRQEGDLLLTLDGADTRCYTHITNMELTKHVIDLGVGRIKRAVQMQPIRGTNKPSGNGRGKEADPACFRLWSEWADVDNFYGKPRSVTFVTSF